MESRNSSFQSTKTAFAIAVALQALDEDEDELVAMIAASPMGEVLAAALGDPR
jgi:hypothetical protein